MSADILDDNSGHLTPDTAAIELIETLARGKSILVSADIREIPDRLLGRIAWNIAVREQRCNMQRILAILGPMPTAARYGQAPTDENDDDTITVAARQNVLKNLVEMVFAECKRRNVTPIQW